MVGRLMGHCMMPSYSLLDDDDDFVMSLREEGNPISMLPHISVDDPAVVSIRGEVGLSLSDIEGRVLKFLRRSPVAGISPYYRVIVNTPIGNSSQPTGLWSMR